MVILQRIKMVNCIDPHATTNTSLKFRFFDLIYIFVVYIYIFHNLLNIHMT